MRPGRGRNVEVEGRLLPVGNTWAGALAYCAVTFTLLWIAVFVARDFVFILIAGLFAAGGFVHLYTAMRATLDARAFGAMNLRVAAVPARIGGRFMGSLRISESAAVRGTVRAELRCVLVWYEEGRREEPVWAEERSFPIRGQAGGSYAILEFAIPPDLTASSPVQHTGSVTRADHYARWEIQAIVESEGAYRDELYMITVQPAEGAAAQAEADASLPMELQRAAPAQADAAAALPAAVPSAPDEHPHEIVRGAAPKPRVPKPVEVAQNLAEPEVLPPREPDRVALALLVAANLVPIAGVAFWGWQVQQVVFLYWMENLVIGGFNVLRILAAEGEPGEDAQKKTPPLGKLGLALFFTVHYGGFCLGHGVFLAGFFGRDVGDTFGTVGGMLARMLREPVVVATLAAMLVSHGWSFFRNFIGRGEYQRVSGADLMTAPYRRIIVTHIFVIVGGTLLGALHSQVLPMLLFIALKVVFDVYFHRREHRGQSEA